MCVCGQQWERAVTPRALAAQDPTKCVCDGGGRVVAWGRPLQSLQSLQSCQCCELSVWGGCLPKVGCSCQLRGLGTWDGRNGSIAGCTCQNRSPGSGLMISQPSSQGDPLPARMTHSRPIPEKAATGRHREPGSEPGSCMPKRRGKLDPRGELKSATKRTI